MDETPFARDEPDLVRTKWLFLSSRLVVTNAQKVGTDAAQSPTCWGGIGGGQTFWAYARLAR